MLDTRCIQKKITGQVQDISEKCIHVIFYDNEDKIEMTYLIEDFLTGVDIKVGDHIEVEITGTIKRPSNTTKQEDNKSVYSDVPEGIIRL